MRVLVWVQIRVGGKLIKIRGSVSGMPIFYGLRPSGMAVLRNHFLLIYPNFFTGIATPKYCESPKQRNGITAADAVTFGENSSTVN